MQLDDEIKLEHFDWATKQTALLTEKEIFLKELNRLISTYTLKAQLLESLATLYYLFIHPKITNEQKNFIASRVAEDVSACSPGFNDRVNYVIICLNNPENLAELVAQARFNLADKIANQIAQNNPQGVHVHTRAMEVARNAGFGVWSINKNDIYLHTGSSNLSDEDIINTLRIGFERHFQFFGLINAQRNVIEALNAVGGYNGKRDSGYVIGEYTKFLECVSRFIPCNLEELFTRNSDEITEDNWLAADKIIDINWQFIKSALLKRLIDEGYVTLSAQESALLNLLVQNEIPEDENTLLSLIPDGYELAQCLEFFSECSKEQKAALVLAYLQIKTPNEQKELLNILKNEVPQLTSQLLTHPSLRGIYFAIAIAEKDVGSVRAYIDEGADINAALLLLFSDGNKRDTLYWLHEHPAYLRRLTEIGLNTVISQGKYQDKTIAETLVSTRKGRQLLLENASLQTVFSNITLDTTLSGILQQAQFESNSVSAQGFFKKSHPGAMELVQAIVYGDLKKSEAILQANSDLLNTLLTEKVTVFDYSRRKVKNKTALQAALCAMDDELCEMLAKYMTKEDMLSQYQAIFPEGHETYYQSQTAFDFTQIVDAISNSNPADVGKALSLELPNVTVLWASLEQFRADFTKRSYQETVFNPQHLIKTFALYDEKYNNWSENQRYLFWRQVIGYVMRFLPANIAMDFAQGLSGRVEKKVKSKRSFNFTYGGGSIFPLVLDSSLAGLGYNYACGIGGAWTGWYACCLPPLRLFQNLCQAKTAILGECMQPESSWDHPSRCLIQ